MKRNDSWLKRSSLILIALALTTCQADGTQTQTLSVNGHSLVVERATTLREQQRGLAGRDMLALNHGLLFVYDESLIPAFWMKGMKFPLDMVWLSKGHVVGVESHVPVDDGTVTYYPPQAIDAVLEVGAGQAEKIGLSPGTSLAY